MSIEIEKGVPLPSLSQPGGMDLLRRMQVGDSVVADAKMTNNIRSNSGRVGAKVTVRKLAENSYRIWMISKK